MASNLNRKGRTIVNRLNPVMKRLSELNGLSMAANLKALGIPPTSKECNTKQLSGYISKAKQEVRKHENKAITEAERYQPAVERALQC